MKMPIPDFSLLLLLRSQIVLPRTKGPLAWDSASCQVAAPYELMNEEVNEVPWWPGHWALVGVSRASCIHLTNVC